MGEAVQTGREAVCGQEFFTKVRWGGAAGAQERNFSLLAKTGLAETFLGRNFYLFLFLLFWVLE